MRHGFIARFMVLIAVCVGVATFGLGGAVSAAPRVDGAVYALTNATGGNAVAVFERARDGTLTAAGSVATGGTGTGSGLGSQGALVLSRNERLLFAVNAGSNDISVFEVRRNGLTLVDREASGGERPISLTIHNDTLYVLNAGGTGNVTGFHIRNGGMLHPLAGSTRPLSSAAADPAQVQFSPDGDVLAVTEKATNTIAVYLVQQDGLLSGPLTQPSAGQTPFGFVFGPHQRLVVTEAFGGAAGAGAVSSYDVADDGQLEVLSGSQPNMQSAPCWVALGKNGRYAYVANTGSGTVSAYRVERSGELRLLKPDGVAGVTGAGSRPADLRVSENGRFLYVRNGGTGTIAAFQIQHGGELVELGATGTLPAGAAGLAVR